MGTRRNVTNKRSQVDTIKVPLSRFLLKMA
jgi:hypothetical protein